LPDPAPSTATTGQQNGNCESYCTGLCDMGPMCSGCTMCGGSLPDPAPSTATTGQQNGAPAASPNSLSVISGQCLASPTGDCVQSPNYPQNYGNGQTCAIGVDPSKALTVEAFDTERGFDKLTVGHRVYHGMLPSGTQLMPSGNAPNSISWRADGSVVRNGWKICQRTSPNTTRQQTTTTHPPQQAYCYSYCTHQHCGIGVGCDGCTMCGGSLPDPAPSTTPGQQNGPAGWRDHLSLSGQQENSATPSANAVGQQALIDSVTTTATNAVGQQRRLLMV